MDTNERGGVQCRLTLPDGRVVEFAMAGPLVTLAPAAAKTEKKSKRGSK